MTFDEERNANVGTKALQAFTGSSAYFELDSLADHGPVYFMIFSATSRAMHRIFPSWPEADWRHFTTYLMFTLGVLCFYLLSLRLMRRRSAWMATIFFATQPLMFGQGFINQKDTPFMVFFLATLVTGMTAADPWRAQNEGDGANAPREGIREAFLEFWGGLRIDWQKLRGGTRLLLGVILVLTLLLVLDLAFIGATYTIGERTVIAAYEGHAPDLVQRLYNLMATDAYKTPLQAYMAKFESAYSQLRLALILVIACFALVVFSLFLPTLRKSWGFSWRAFRQPALLISAVLLGFTICVRQLGVFVGGLVSLYMLYRTRSRAVFPLILYWAMAAVAAFATWPYLWPDPFGRFMESLQLGVAFPPHRTFYQGRWISSKILPWHYFPRLASLELTEPAVLLILIGVGIAAWRLLKGDTRWFLYGLLGLWAGVPLVGLVFFDMTVYGNIRHLLFMLPPLLILAGIALEAVLGRLRRDWARWLAFGLAIAPGIWGIIRLHPYEYIYMNSLVGGVSGAYGQYELDRQCISLREGIEFVNEVAEPETTVMVLRQVSAVVPYARADLELIDDRWSVIFADFVLSCYWPGGTDLGPRGFEQVYEVRVGEAVLADVWQRPPAE